MGERGNYYSQEGEREPEDLMPFLQSALLVLAIGAGLFLLGAWQEQAAPSGAHGAALSPTPPSGQGFNPPSVLSPQNATFPARFKNQSFAPETIVVDNAAITLTRSVGFAAGKRIETLVFNNTGNSTASFRTLVMFPKKIAQKASDIEVAGAAPGEVYVLQEDPSLFVGLKDLASGASKTISFLSPVQTITGLLGGGGGEDFSAGSIHFALGESRFPISSDDRARLDDLLNSPWLQAQSGEDAQKTSEMLSKILNGGGSFADALAAAEALFSTTASGENLGNETATGEKIEAPTPRQCSNGSIIVSEFMPGFYCEEQVAGDFSNPEMRFDYAIRGLDAFKPGLSVAYDGENGKIIVSADYRQLIKGGKMPFSPASAQGAVEYGDLTKPRNPDGSLRKFSFAVSLQYENNFNNYVKIWPPKLLFKEYEGKAVQKAVLVFNNLPYDLEGFDFVVCGRKMGIKAGEVGAFAATTADKDCKITQRGEQVQMSIPMGVFHIDFLPKEEAKKFVSEDYLEPRIYPFPADICSGRYCNCNETPPAATLFASDFGKMLPSDTFSYKNLFGNGYSASRLFLLARTPENAACPLPGEFQGFGLWPARLNIAKLNADLREGGEKTALENNGYWAGNWATTAGKSGVTGFSGNGDLDNALSGLAKEQYLYYSADADNKLTKSDENSFYTLGQR